MLYFDMPSVEEIRIFLMADIVLSITVGMSILLAVISIFSGWRRFDLAAIGNPLTLTQVGIAILLALVIRIFEQSSYAQFNLEFLPLKQPLLGLSYLPLIIITIALGPSIGLLSVALFLALTPPLGSFNWLDAVLMLEFVVLGWWAIFPSSFQKRWAGSTNLLISYILVWGTAGSALFHSQGLDIRDWRVHFNCHQNYLLSLLISVLFLFLLGPGFFNRLFSNSRIKPKEAKPTKSSSRVTGLAIQQISASPNSPTHFRRGFQKPDISSLKRNDTRARTMSKSPSRIAMKSFKDQDH